MERLSTVSRRRHIAYDNNMSGTLIKEVMLAYFEVLQEEIKRGYNIEIFPLVTIKYVNRDATTTTLAFQAKEVAEKTKISYYTCLGIIKQYIKSSEQDLLDGKPVNLRGIVSLKVSNGSKAKIYSVTSKTIKYDMENESNRLRAFTSEYLKTKVNKAGSI